MEKQRIAPSAGAVIRHGLLGWLTASAVEYFRLPQPLRDLSTLEGLAQMSPVRFLFIALGTSVLVWLLSRFRDLALAQRWLIAGLFALEAAAALQARFSLGFLGGCLGILAVLALFAARGWRSQDPPPKKAAGARPVYRWITLGVSAAFFLFVSCWGLGRLYSFSCPTYDMGIFSQMFYSMKETGLPVTTLERDGPLSHFAVHVSPVYYLLLPAYRLFPTPAALPVLQAAVLTSAVIPLWKLGKCHGLTGGQRMLCCGMLLLYPALAGGTGYDIHENCFLTPLLLWLMWCLDSRSLPVASAAALLTLGVKEDAAVYVAVIGLWQLARGALAFRKTRWKGLLPGGALLAGALAWFVLVTGYLETGGDGVMTYRYRNFMYDGSGSLVTVVTSVLLCPMKAVWECLEPEKLPFLALTLGPVLGLPLMTRRYERYLLLIPYLLVNLMSDYRYQHDLFFQYTFGSTALLVYLTLVNLADLRISLRRTLALAGAVAVSAACFGAVVAPKAAGYPAKAIRYRDYYQSLREALSQIPEDASVAATTFYTTPLSQRETVYDIRYSSREHVLQCRYIVLDPTSKDVYEAYAAEDGDGFSALQALLEDRGYRLYSHPTQTLAIYRKAQEASGETGKD